MVDIQERSPSQLSHYSDDINTSQLAVYHDTLAPDTCHMSTTRCEMVETRFNETIQLLENSNSFVDDVKAAGYNGEDVDKHNERVESSTKDLALSMAMLKTVAVTLAKENELAVNKTTEMDDPASILNHDEKSRGIDSMFL